jgi:hypothetical protein
MRVLHSGNSWAAKSYSRRIRIVETLARRFFYDAAFTHTMMRGLVAASLGQMTVLSLIKVTGLLRGPQYPSTSTSFWLHSPHGPPGTNSPRLTPADRDRERLTCGRSVVEPARCITAMPCLRCDHRAYPSGGGLVEMTRRKSEIAWEMPGPSRGSWCLLAPPALGERGHRVLASCGVAMRGRAIFVVPKGQRPHPRHS